ncbi:putative DNA primase/helicase [Lactobacillus colini]|uniref:DNA primase/helicase n=1 Tax=Lactobacillus colini TaxID=1819254 RepID=A0ABS4MH03_9LACO|nr:DNA primase family protein [Lactobacillus colini]MBP2058956.1 putative DNA primase/helicase [Lactobacillus colini]
MDKLERILKQYGNKSFLPASPNWWFIDENQITHVNIPLLGKTIINKNDFLYMVNGTKESIFYYSGDELGYWIEAPANYINQLVGKELDAIKGAWTAKREKEAVQYIQSHAKRVFTKDTIYKPNIQKFNFKNGVFNWQTMKLEPHSRKYFFTSTSGVNLNTKSVETPMLDKWFKLSFQENYKTMMEFIGYIFYGSYSPINAFIILKSKGNDGKSTFINQWLVPAVGNDNVSSISLVDIAGKNISEFKLSELQGKYLNAHAENSEVPINDTARLKMLTGGDRINASVKGKGDIIFTNNAKMLFGTNNLPAFNDNTNGMRRRSIVIPFNKIENFDNVIDFQKVKEETPAFIYKCIQATKKAIKRKKFTTTSSIKKARDEWLGLNDPIGAFLEENTVRSSNEQTDRTEIYNAYCNYCELNGYKPTNSRNFAKDLRDNKKLKQTIHKTRNGRVYYFNVKIITNISRMHPADHYKK